ncbi:hypothetical protein B0H14DRAFT_3498824 [Mycena olivaceomarginata]|nr:hypothetical protein B0H14DRAFT_3498824 [Mycena olivaceomarginata]
MHHDPLDIAIRTLDLVQLVLICQSVYHYLARNWGNQNCATLLCQGFFLRRVWKFSKNLPLTLFLAAACLTTGIIDIIMAVQTISNLSLNTILSHKFSAEVISVFAVGAAVDLAIAAILCWYLARELTVFDRINNLVARLIQYTVATGLITSLLALGCLIAVRLVRTSRPPTVSYFMAMHFSLGRMYTNALLATLNSRKVLRKQLAPPTLHWSRPTEHSVPAFAHSELATQETQEFQLKDVRGQRDERPALSTTHHGTRSLTLAAAFPAPRRCQRELPHQRLARQQETAVRLATLAPLPPLPTLSQEVRDKALTVRLALGS